MIRPDSTDSHRFVQRQDLGAVASAEPAPSLAIVVKAKGQSGPAHDLARASFCTRLGTGGGAGNPRNRANRHWRCFAYQACRARSRVRLTLVASIVRVLSSSGPVIRQSNLPWPKPGETGQICHAKLGRALGTSQTKLRLVRPKSGREQPAWRCHYCLLLIVTPGQSSVRKGVAGNPAAL